MCLCMGGGIENLWRQREKDPNRIFSRFSGKEGDMSKRKFMKVAKGLVVNS